MSSAPDDTLGVYQGRVYPVHKKSGRLRRSSSQLGGFGSKPLYNVDSSKRLPSTKVSSTKVRTPMKKKREIVAIKATDEVLPAWALSPVNDSTPTDLTPLYDLGIPYTPPTTLALPPWASRLGGTPTPPPEPSPIRPPSPSPSTSTQYVQVGGVDTGSQVEESALEADHTPNETIIHKSAEDTSSHWSPMVLWTPQQEEREKLHLVDTPEVLKRTKCEKCGEAHHTLQCRKPNTRAVKNRHKPKGTPSPPPWAKTPQANEEVQRTTPRSGSAWSVSDDSDDGLRHLPVPPGLPISNSPFVSPQNHEAQEQGILARADQNTQASSPPPSSPPPGSPTGALDRASCELGKLNNDWKSSLKVLDVSLDTTQPVGNDPVGDDLSATEVSLKKLTDATEEKLTSTITKMTQQALNVITSVGSREDEVTLREKEIAEREMTLKVKEAEVQIHSEMHSLDEGFKRELKEQREHIARLKKMKEDEDIETKKWVLHKEQQILHEKTQREIQAKKEEEERKERVRQRREVEEQERLVLEQKKVARQRERERAEVEHEHRKREVALLKEKEEAEIEKHRTEELLEAEKRRKQEAEEELNRLKAQRKKEQQRLREEEAQHLKAVEAAQAELHKKEFELKQKLERESDKLEKERHAIQKKLAKEQQQSMKQVKDREIELIEKETSFNEMLDASFQKEKDAILENERRLQREIETLREADSKRQQEVVGQMQLVDEKSAMVRQEERRLVALKEEANLSLHRQATEAEQEKAQIKRLQHELELAKEHFEYLQQKNAFERAAQEEELQKEKMALMRQRQELATARREQEEASQKAEREERERQADKQRRTIKAQEELLEKQQREADEAKRAQEEQLEKKQREMMEEVQLAESLSKAAREREEAALRRQREELERERNRMLEEMQLHSETTTKARMEEQKRAAELERERVALWQQQRHFEEEKLREQEKAEALEALRTAELTIVTRLAPHEADGREEVQTFEQHGRQRYLFLQLDAEKCLIAEAESRKRTKLLHKYLSRRERAERAVLWGKEEATSRSLQRHALLDCESVGREAVTVGWVQIWPVLKIEWKEAISREMHLQKHAQRTLELQKVFVREASYTVETTESNIRVDIGMLELKERQEIFLEHTIVLPLVNKGTPKRAPPPPPVDVLGSEAETGTTETLSEVATPRVLEVDISDDSMEVTMPVAEKKTPQRSPPAPPSPSESSASSSSFLSSSTDSTQPLTPSKCDLRRRSGIVQVAVPRSHSLPARTGSPFIPATASPPKSKPSARTTDELFATAIIPDEDEDREYPKYKKRSSYSEGFKTMDRDRKRKVKDAMKEMKNRAGEGRSLRDVHRRRGKQAVYATEAAGSVWLDRLATTARGQKVQFVPEDEKGGQYDNTQEVQSSVYKPTAETMLEELHFTDGKKAKGKEIKESDKKGPKKTYPAPVQSGESGVFVQAPQKALLTQIDPKFGLAVLRKAIDHATGPPPSVELKTKKKPTKLKDQQGDRLSLLNIPIREALERDQITSSEMKRLKNILLCHKDAITRLHIRGPFSVSPALSHSSPPIAPWHPPPCKVAPTSSHKPDKSMRSSSAASTVSTLESEAFWTRRISNFLQPILP